MVINSYKEFRVDLKSLPDFSGNPRISFECYSRLAFGILWIAAYWSKYLNAWELRVPKSKRPWVYAGLLIGLAVLILLPQYFKIPKVERPYHPISISIPIVPIEPTIIPDSLLIYSILNQQNHEK